MRTFPLADKRRAPILRSVNARRLNCNEQSAPSDVMLQGVKPSAVLSNLIQHVCSINSDVERSKYCVEPTKQLSVLLRVDLVSECIYTGLI